MATPPTIKISVIKGTSAGACNAAAIGTAIESRDAVGQLTQFAEQCVSDRRQAADNADHQQRNQQYPLECQNAAAFAVSRPRSTYSIHSCLPDELAV